MNSATYINKQLNKRNAINEIKLRMKIIADYYRVKYSKKYIKDRILKDCLRIHKEIRPLVVLYKRIK